MNEGQKTFLPEVGIEPAIRGIPPGLLYPILPSYIPDIEHRGSHGKTFLLSSRERSPSYGPCAAPAYGVQFF